MKVYRVYVKFHNADIGENDPKGQEYFVHGETSHDAVQLVLNNCVRNFAAIMIDELANASIITPE